MYVHEAWVRSPSFTAESCIQLCYPSANIREPVYLCAYTPTYTPRVVNQAVAMPEAGAVRAAVVETSSSSRRGGGCDGSSSSSGSVVAVVVRRRHCRRRGSSN